jgi:hypothetical protein
MVDSSRGFSILWRILIVLILTAGAAILSYCMVRISNKEVKTPTNKDVVVHIDEKPLSQDKNQASEFVSSTTSGRTEKRQSVDVGVVIIKYADTIIPPLVLCRWKTGEESLAFEKCFDINVGGDGEIVGTYSFVDLITDKANKDISLGRNNIRSIYYLEDYFHEAAKKYNIDYQINLKYAGIFNITTPLPPVNLRASQSGYLMNDVDAFLEKIKKETRTSSFDNLIVIFLNDQDFQTRGPEYQFASFAATWKNTIIQNFRVATDLLDQSQYVDVLAHEFGHINGASDLYLEPCPKGKNWVCCRDPEGIPEPFKSPKYPQKRACLMCPIKILGADGEGQYAGLNERDICDATAKEMGWMSAVK